MLTIPANMQTALKKNPNQEFRYIIKMGRSKIAADYDASNFYFSSNATFGALNVGITDTSVYPVVPILLNEPQITENLDLREHTSTVGGFSLDLDDNFKFQNPDNSSALEKFSDQLNTYNIYNKDLYIYLWLPGLTNLQTECLAIYQGIVGDIDISDGKVKIAISNSTFKVQKDLPQTLISTSDGFYVPAESIGKPKSLVYGDHPFYYGQDGTLTNITHNQENNLVPTKYLGIDVDGKHMYSIAIHSLDTTNAAQYRAWMYDTNLSRFVKIDTTQVTYTGGIIKVDNLPNLFDYWYPDGTVTDGLSTGLDWYDRTKSCDLNYATFAHAQMTAANAVNDTATYGIDFPAYDGYQDDSAITRINTFGKSYFATSGDPDVFEIDGASATGYGAATLNLYNYVIDASATKAEIATYISVVVRKDLDQAETLDYRVYMIFKEIKYTTTEMFPVFIACKGREYSGTWGARKTAGNLIENPADIIESILRDELGMSTEINTTLFDNVNTELTSWKLAPFIDTQQNSKVLLNKIAEQAMAFIYWDATNKAAMDTFYAANTTDYTFQTNDIQGRPLLYKSPLKDIVNDFTLKYHKGAQGNLQSIISRANSTANTGSQAVYNAVMDMTMDADFISDATTAGLLANHWCKDGATASFWSVLHNVIEFETVDLRGVNFWNAGAFKPILGLELTDIIELHSDWDAIMELYGATWASVQFKIFSITRLPDSLKIKAFSL
uniref:Uncharacterized protein n=1 Tax=viral metagenome TaxID=1070528 RepID=A0A6M3KF74_9ZZZZ